MLELLVYDLIYAGNALSKTGSMSLDGVEQ